MNALLGIPYANGDCQRGFVYKGKRITRQEYDRLITNEYFSHKEGIDYQMWNNLGNNMAINPYQKRKIKYTQMTYFFHVCPCQIFDMNGESFTLSDLNALYRTGDNFIAIVHLDRQTFYEDEDLKADIKLYLKESKSVTDLHNLGYITDVDMLKSLPVKDFKLRIDEDNSLAMLHKCQVLKRMGQDNTKFMIMVDKINFYSTDGNKTDKQ